MYEILTEEKIMNYPDYAKVLPVENIDNHIECVGFGIKYLLAKAKQHGSTALLAHDFTKRLKNLMKDINKPLTDTQIQSFINYFVAIKLIYCDGRVVGMYQDYAKERYIYNRISERRLSCRYANYKHHKISTLSDEQNDAVENAIKNNICIISGGAGTGKTTTIDTIIQSFKKQYPQKNVFVLTPTGKACKRVKETLSRNDIEVHTIHYFVGYGHPFLQRDRDRANSADLIIIDESSMMDVNIFYTLLNITSANIVLVGDINQLPSVDSGNILQDLIQLGVKTCYLTRNFRNQSTILNNAQNVLNNVADFKQDNSFVLTKLDESDVTDYLANCDADIILTPYRKEDIFGSSLSVNKAVQDRKGFVRNNKICYSVGNPVIMIRTDKKRRYFNGETGTICGISPHALYVDFGDRTVEVTEADDCELAYATTIHKSQGSEYGKVTIYCPNTSFVTKEMLYTAITRAKSRINIVYTDDNFLTDTLKRTEQCRKTFLQSFLMSA